MMLPLNSPLSESEAHTLHKCQVENETRLVAEHEPAPAPTPVDVARTQIQTFGHKYLN